MSYMCVIFVHLPKHIQTKTGHSLVVFGIGRRFSSQTRVQYFKSYHNSYSLFGRIQIEMKIAEPEDEQT